MQEFTTVDRQSTAAAVVAPVGTHASRISRRRVLLAGFWGAVGALFTGAAATVLNTVFPRNVTGFGGPITVPAFAVPKPGDPPKPVVEGRFLLVNLKPGEGNMSGDDAATPGGLIALYRKCPHLGCTVPWRADASYKGLRGVFLCPCHGSTYTKAGVRVFGPAERSMDTMAIEAKNSGDVVVQTGDITEGNIDNARRAIPYVPPPAT
jgi:cytochrome b6-f complex iron-sulfur subunit